MVQIAKQATQDGTFTIYLGDRPIAWSLTSHAADALVERLQAVPATILKAPRLE
ncbi:hypothetical protein [Microvirga splendida]|uniref:Uncharacterized protein n=1 Tax=Microvirga splendida TaxID=2795727 RepID=A0ABS0XYF2_9HYPH|nr:hypothetical protein [Microvirga splendida]MBJ6125078.1 hypothetical protein [Microvirga splendida]